MLLAEEETPSETNSKKRRLRRKKLKLAVAATNTFFASYFNSLEGSCDNPIILNANVHKELNTVQVSSKTCTSIDPVPFKNCDKVSNVDNQVINNNTVELNSMSSKDTDKARDEVKAAREAKKLAKQKAKNKGDATITEKVDSVPKKDPVKSEKEKKELKKVTEGSTKVKIPLKCVDEVDRAIIKNDSVICGKPNEKEKMLPENAAKKAEKQDSKKSEPGVKSNTPQGDCKPKHDVENTKMAKPNSKKCSEKPDAKRGSEKPEVKKVSNEPEAKKASEVVKGNPDMTVKDVVETLKNIKKVATEVQDLTAKVSAISFEPKDSEAGKSKAELKAERRAKQEAQRAAKQAAAEEKVQVKAKPTPVVEVKTKDVVKEKSPKPKSEKPKVKSGSAGRLHWFQHLHTELDNDALNKIPINSNLHPAIIKLGVRLATRVVSGSNARCVALLDAVKKMVKDYSLPAKTEFARGLEAHLAASLEFLWSMRRPSASQSNAIKYFRHQLQQLPNNVDEFDAKKKLQEEIDKYIEDQIDKAGEAISEAVRHKISTGDNILTYGCSSLIERILCEAWEAKVEFRTIIVGNKVHNGAREMLRRLTVAGLHCTYADITAISYVMKSINKVILGASSLLVNGSVLGAVGTAQVALAAKECNVPVLVACETHKFSEKVQTDAFVYNELGNPDELIISDNSPLKDWRNNPNLTLLNVTYDVTPPSLVTAVVTEKAILPCTSAPVVLRTKLSEYGM